MVSLIPKYVNLFTFMGQYCDNAYIFAAQEIR